MSCVDIDVDTTGADTMHWIRPKTPQINTITRKLKEVLQATIRC